MAQHRTVMLWALGAALTLGGCSKSQPSTDISEDQLNHFAGVTTHDHPDNGSAQAEAGSSNLATADAPSRVDD